MKILFILFVFLFPFSLFGNDITDFQIEGMSIGDSLLDYLNEKEINNNIVEIYDYYERLK